jgi:antitoxin ParD1/3/4
MDVSLSLAPDVVALIEAQIRTGRYASSSDVVSAAVRLLQDADTADAARLRRAWEEGIASGDAGSIDVTALRAKALRELKTPRGLSGCCMERATSAPAFSAGPGTELWNRDGSRS